MSLERHTVDCVHISISSCLTGGKEATEGHQTYQAHESAFIIEKTRNLNCRQILQTQIDQVTHLFETLHVVVLEPSTFMTEKLII